MTVLVRYTGEDTANSTPWYAVLRDEQVKNKFFGIKTAGSLNYGRPGCYIM